MSVAERRYALPLWRCAGCTDGEYAETRPKGWAWTVGTDGARVLVCPACRIRLVAERRAARPRRPARRGGSKA